MIYFTSDFHFGHDKEFLWKVRGYSSVEEMNEDLVKKYNEIISDDDIVYILGDCIMGDLSNVKYLTQLKGQKYLAYGNHDTDRRLALFAEMGIFKDIQMGYRIKSGKKTFCLSHYPQVVYNGDDPSKVYSLHGHTHQTTPYTYEGENRKPMIHVGVDSYDGRPISLDTIKKLIKGEK